MIKSIKKMITSIIACITIVLMIIHHYSSDVGINHDFAADNLDLAHDLDDDPDNDSNGSDDDADDPNDGTDDADDPDPDSDNHYSLGGIDSFNDSPIIRAYINRNKYYQFPLSDIDNDSSTSDDRDGISDDRDNLSDDSHKVLEYSPVRQSYCVKSPKGSLSEDEFTYHDMISNVVRCAFTDAEPVSTFSDAYFSDDFDDALVAQKRVRSLTDCDSHDDAIRSTRGTHTDTEILARRGDDRPKLVSTVSDSNDGKFNLDALMRECSNGDSARIVSSVVAPYDLDSDSDFESDFDEPTTRRYQDRIDASLSAESPDVFPPSYISSDNEFSNSSIRDISSGPDDPAPAISAPGTDSDDEPDVEPGIDYSPFTHRRANFFYDRMMDFVHNHDIGKYDGVDPDAYVFNAHS